MMGWEECLLKILNYFTKYPRHVLHNIKVSRNNMKYFWYEQHEIVHFVEVHTPINISGIQLALSAISI